MEVSNLTDEMHEPDEQSEHVEADAEAMAGLAPESVDEVATPPEQPLRSPEDPSSYADTDALAPVVASPDAAAPAPVVASPDAALVEGVEGSLTWVPFGAYLGLWLVLAGVTAYVLYGASPDQPARWMAAYAPLLWSGVGLTAAGPLLSLVVWLVARSRRPRDARRGLLASAMTRGSLVAFFGVAVWIGTLFVLELLAARGTV